MAIVNLTLKTAKFAEIKKEDNKSYFGAAEEEDDTLEDDEDQEDDEDNEDLDESDAMEDFGDE